MAAPTGIECFAEDLSCSICLELFSDPVILECGHNYCQVCITRFWWLMSGILYLALWFLPQTPKTLTLDCLLLTSSLS
uniref:RING-type domain-containing protein n=1 Tax=Laticauda laticaudata TaxID=8630 RepID=A0A8C5SXH4_LATLA